MRPNILVGLANKAVESEKARLANEAVAGNGGAGAPNPPAAGAPPADPPNPQSPPAPQSEEEKKERETFNALFEKFTGGKKYDEVQSAFSRKSLDDEIAEVFGKPRTEVDNLIKNPPADPSLEFKTPLLKQHYEFVEAGGTEEQWEANVALKKSLATMSHENLIKHSLRQENPGAEAADIDTLYSSLYRIPKELDATKFYEEEVQDRLDEIAAAKVRIKVQAEKIRAAEQAKTVEALKAPVRTEKPVDPKIIEAGKKIRKTVYDTFDATKGIEIEIVEGEKGKETRAKLNFDLKPEQRELAKQILNSPTGFFDAMCSEAGGLDTEKFVRMATLVAGGNEAIETMAMDLANAKLAEFIKGLKNANFEMAEGTPLGDQMQTILKKATKQVFGAHKK